MEHHVLIESEIENTWIVFQVADNGSRIAVGSVRLNDAGSWQLKRNEPLITQWYNSMTLRQDVDPVRALTLELQSLFGNTPFDFELSDGKLEDVESYLIKLRRATSAGLSE